MGKKHQHRTKPNRLRQLFTRANKVGSQPSEEGHAEDAEQGREVERQPPPVIPRGPENQTPNSQHAEAEADHRTQQLAKPAWTDKAQAYAAVAIAFFSLVTLFVISYQLRAMKEQSTAMQGQLNAVNRQADLMGKQLESMNSSSKQTQDLIAATRETANASQSVAEQNKELVKHAGEQANAAATQAAASQTQAKASVAQAEAARQSLGAAQTSARAAEQSAQVASEAFNIGQRPYLIVTEPTSVAFTAGQGPTVNIRIENSGNTPAYGLSFNTYFSFRPDPFTGRLEYKIGPESENRYSEDIVPAHYGNTFRYISRLSISEDYRD